MKLFIKIVLFLSIQTIEAKVTTCEIVNDKSDFSKLVLCKDILKKKPAYLSSFVRADQVEVKNKKKVILESKKLFDLTSGAYLNGRSFVNTEGLRNVTLDLDRNNLFKDPELTKVEFGCTWENGKVSKMDLDGCPVCTGLTKCNFGNGEVVTQSFCKQIPVHDKFVCPTAIECYSDQSLEQVKLKKQPQINGDDEKASTPAKQR